MLFYGRMRLVNALGVSRDAALAEIEAQFKRKARSAHPDAGGTTEAMAQLNAAIAEARCLKATEQSSSRKRANG